MTPKLVKDRVTGKLCLQVVTGKHSATIELPDDFNDWPEARKENFIAMFVNESAKNLKLKSPYKRG